MEILTHRDYKDLLAYVPTIKSSLTEWQIVDIRLATDCMLMVADVAERIHSLFKNAEGKIFQCNNREIVMLIKLKSPAPHGLLVKQIEDSLPEGTCEIVAQNLTPEGLRKIEILITHKPQNKSSMHDTRTQRSENIILVADDDMYMRSLVRAGLGNMASVYEADNGEDAIEAYKKYNPDILLLDIHMPGKNGVDVLKSIFAFDLDAHIVMLTADSSISNITYTSKLGVKGFMAKPFNKKTLLDNVYKCQTFS